MAKIVDGLKCSASALFFAICISATLAENGQPEIYTCKHPCVGWRVYRCCSRITRPETDTCNYNCTSSYSNRCCENNTCTLYETDKTTFCGFGWEAPPCNIDQETTVPMPPRIIKNYGPQKNIIFRSCTFFTLYCKAEGTPYIRYEWKRNGFAINRTLLNVHEGEFGTIIIFAGTSMAEGFYQCFASNQYGTAVSKMTRVQRAFLESTSGPPNVLQKTVDEGMPFHIQADPRKSFPTPTYGWEMAADTEDKNSTSLPLSKRIQIAENGDLYFAYALPEDNLNGNIYKSITYNGFLNITSEGGYTQVTVITNPAGINEFAPALGFSSEAQTVAVIGGSVTLRCFFSGYPVPNISWSGPRNSLPDGRYFLDKFNTELNISSVNESDEGDYNCIASNNQGSKTHSLQLRVEAEPKFNSTEDGPYDVIVTEGESVIFNCSAFAKPKADTVWLQNGQPIDTNNSPSRFVFSNDKKRLTIRDICRDCKDQESQTDLAFIHCNASNIHGYAFASGYLNVLRRTKVSLPNSTLVIVDLTKENHLQFNCSATSDPSTPPTVQWYRIGPHGQESVHNEPPYVYVTNGSLTINTDPNCSTTCDKYLGEYRCVGDNGYSQDFATVTLSATVNPETKGISVIWQAVLAVVIICLLLGTIGLIVVWYRKRYNAGINYDTITNTNPNSIYEDTGYDSINVQREEVNAECPVQRADSMHEQVRCDSIELSPVAAITSAMMNQSTPNMDLAPDPISSSNVYDSTC